MLAATLFLGGCATYQGKVQKAREHLTAGQTQEAIKLLEPLSAKSDNDQLIYLFDYATALQIAGDFKKSNDSFALSDRMSDAKNYLSITQFTGSLLLNEEMQHYKGEDYERLLINVMSAINYIYLNDRESALVEIRRLNEKLEYFRLEEKKEYQQNTAALYLSALMWEADKNWDSAYIDYERAFNRDESIGYIGEDLVRLAIKADRPEKAQKWKKKFSVKEKADWKNKNLGELILIYQQGWGPRKAERARILTSVGYMTPGFPKLEPVPTFTKRARLEITEAPGGNNPGDGPILLSEETRFIYSVQDNAIKTLEDSYAPLIAKKIAAFIAKETVANQVGKNNEAMGALLKIAMHVADRADLRQWSTLPETFQVARLRMKPGRYNVSIKGLLQSGMPSGEEAPMQTVEILPDKKTFIGWRSFK